MLLGIVVVDDALVVTHGYGRGQSASEWVVLSLRLRAGSRVRLVFLVRLHSLNVSIWHCTEGWTHTIRPSLTAGWTSTLIENPTSQAHATFETQNEPLRWWPGALEATSPGLDWSAVYSAAGYKRHLSL